MLVFQVVMYDADMAEKDPYTYLDAFQPVFEKLTDAVLWAKKELDDYAESQMIPAPTSIPWENKGSYHMAAEVTLKDGNTFTIAIAGVEVRTKLEN